MAIAFEDEHDAHRAGTMAIALDAPRIFAALNDLEDSIVFQGERERLNRVLDDMELFDVRTDSRLGGSLG